MRHENQDIDQDIDYILKEPLKERQYSKLM